MAILHLHNLNHYLFFDMRYLLLLTIACFLGNINTALAQNTANTTTPAANTSTSSSNGDVIDKYDLFKIIQRKLPATWLIAQREDKPGQMYFAISRSNSYLVRNEIPYSGDPTQEDAWAKKNGNELPYEIHLLFEPYSYDAYKALRGSNTDAVPASSSTTASLSPSTLAGKELIADLENKYGIKEIAFDKDANTYAAFSKDEKDRLVNFLLAKEYYGGRPLVVNTGGPLPTFYVKDNMVAIRYKYPIEEFRVYPKQVAAEAQRIEQIIKEALQPK